MKGRSLYTDPRLRGRMAGEKFSDDAPPRVYPLEEENTLVTILVRRGTRARLDRVKRRLGPDTTRTETYDSVVRRMLGEAKA